MPFTYDSTGLDQMRTNEAIPEGSYILEIEFAEEKISSKGDPMVVVDFKVAGGTYKGKKIRYHHVTFLGKDPTTNKFKPGAGFALHFVKTIGEPWEGEFDVTPLRWVGKQLAAKVIQEKDSMGIARNKIQFVSPVEGKKIEDEALPF